MTRKDSLGKPDKHTERMERTWSLDARIAKSQLLAVPRVRKIFVRNSGNGCINFMDAWKNALFLQEKPMSIKFLVLGGGGISSFGGGGGECRFYFYGHADFSEQLLAVRRPPESRNRFLVSISWFPTAIALHRPQIGPPARNGKKWPKNGFWEKGGKIGRKWKMALVSHFSANFLPFFDHFPPLLLVGPEAIFRPFFSHFGPEARFGVCTGQSRSKFLVTLFLQGSFSLRGLTL